MKLARINPIAVALITLGCLSLSLDALAQKASLFPEPEIASEQTIEGRRVLRYEHRSNTALGYQAPQDDYFHFIPAKETAKNVPLRVVLHSAGCSADIALARAFKNPHWLHYYEGEYFHVLYLDCRRNKSIDWWWGYHEIKRNPERYRDKLTPTEARVLSTVEWVIQKYDVDRNRVYLSGISMGGSGSLGIGLCRGDIFAAISVCVPAGVAHIEFRMADGEHPDPPPLFNFSSHVDGWSKGQERLLAYAEKNKYPVHFAWGVSGHSSDVTAANPGVLEFPWLSIRKDEAYPVFTRASTDNRYPGFKNKTAADQTGQINGYFRWKTIEDSGERLVMELRLIKSAELKNAINAPQQATADVTLRRIQKFRISPGAKIEWSLIREGKVLNTGKIETNANGNVTVPELTITDGPSQLHIVRD
ncbi:MAG: putative esterase [Rhodothermales bacterium]|jgi:predicted esterase